MTVPATDLTTVASLAAYLGGSFTDVQMALLQQFVSAASELIESYTNRDLVAQDYVDNRDGNGRARMLLINYPINTLKSVTFNGNQSIPLLAATDFTSMGCRATLWAIQLQGCRFPCGQGNINIQYNAGYTPVPYDLQMAANQIAAYNFQTKNRLGQSGSESIAGQSISFRDLSMPAAAMLALQAYKRTIQAER